VREHFSPFTFNPAISDRTRQIDEESKQKLLRKREVSADALMQTTRLNETPKNIDRIQMLFMRKK